MRFNLLSDLHLERNPREYATFEFSATAPYLILAGDIGNVADPGFQHFLLRAALVYVGVVFILGNHEPFGLTHKEALRRSRAIAAKAPNLYFLENGSVQLDDTLVLGTTLFSHLPVNCIVRVLQNMADFRYINGWSPLQHNKAYLSALDWLCKFPYPENGKLLVVTHHAPTTENVSDPKYTDPAMAHAFATELKEGTFWPRVNAWIYGHTHYNPGERMHDGVRLITNMRGYTHEGVENYKADAVFSI
jgi:predicted phosphodiesterase